MSVIYTKKVKAFNNKPINVERFDTPFEVVDVGNTRQLMPCFSDERGRARDKSWTGVADFAEAQRYMADGYQPTVDKMKNIDIKLEGQGKRFGFRNEVVGFTPVVPLVLQGVPNCMVNTHIKPIKAKVINVFYDMTASCGTDKEDMLEAGQRLLAACMELEMQGYKFNLYCTQTYWDRTDGDVICVKIKNANTPLNLKRMSFALTHPAFFRVIGFDWYSRFPNGKYRAGYGHAIGYDFTDDVVSKGFEELFDQRCVVFTCSRAIRYDKESFKKTLQGGKCYE